jgi:nicotinamide phosphoribosyltransferase
LSKEDSLDNVLLRGDSYKYFHGFCYPEGTVGMYDYVESRGGDFEYTNFFGLQAYAKRYLMTPITMDDVKYAHERITKHGLPFNYDVWERVVNVHGGRLPITVRAVPEGTIVPTLNALVTVESTEPYCYSVASHVETSLLRAAWYGSGPSTISWHSKQIWRHWLEETSDDPEGQLPFKHHDFGARGASSAETAEIGGGGHLTCFMGTDTVEALEYMHKYYHADMAGFSIPATEHSLMCAEGRTGEASVVMRVLKWCRDNDKHLVSIVGDTYDIYHFVRSIIGSSEVKDFIISNNIKIVVRPDSGNPLEVPLDVMQLLAVEYGTTRNSKGYDVLHPNVGVIQGDGMNLETMTELIKRTARIGFSLDNLVVGMGGALLQKIDRDTGKYAMKASAYKQAYHGWYDVYKDPITDAGKVSKRGRQMLLQNQETREFRTINVEELMAENSIYAEPHTPWMDAMHTIYHNGKLEIDWTLDEIRKRTDEFKLTYSDKGVPATWAKRLIAAPAQLVGHID